MKQDTRFKIVAGLFATLLLVGALWYGNEPKRNGEQELGAVCNNITDANVFSRIKNLPIQAKDQGAFKGVEVAKLNCIPKVRRTSLYGDYYIEVTEMKAIERGIELYARAWDSNNQQIGFGRDGTIDLERFVILNPPILVEDPAGSVAITVNADPTGVKAQTFRFREDLRESLLQSLEHTLAVKQQKYDSSKIVRGKKGNTTTTVYPNPDPESTSVDGVSGVTNGVTFALAHDAADGNYTDDTSNAHNACNVEVTTAVYQIIRGFFLFDTSAIPDTDVIDSGTLSLY